MLSVADPGKIQRCLSLGEERLQKIKKVVSICSVQL